MRSLGLLLLTLFVVVVVADEPCAHDHLANEFLAEHGEGYAKWLDLMHETRDLYKRDNEVLRIPVVWHVLTDRPGNRVSRQAIEQDMLFLNQWYSGNNKDFFIDGLFANVAATGEDLKIRFELAVLDPDGNPTDGIVYIENSPLAEEGCSFGTDAMYYDSQGGDNIWDSRYYFNIYTCGIPGGTAGFAAIGGYGTGPKDGCVMDYIYIGSQSSAGGILAHEAGHWLGLRHTFNQDSCSADDGFSDTPNTDGPYSTWGSAIADRCNDAQSTTSHVRCGNTVQVRNVMDYSPCESYFSKQQAAHMRNLLTNPNSARHTLITSYALPNSCPTFDCYQKGCGPDGCGGSCGNCPALTVCTDTQECISTVPKNNACGTADQFPQSTTGTTIAKNNDGVSTNLRYGWCGPGGLSHGNAGLYYQFTPSANGKAIFSTTGSAFPTLLSVLYSSNVNSPCSFDYCAAWGLRDGGTINVQTGRVYTMIVSGETDANRGVVSLTMRMEGNFPSCAANCIDKTCGSDGCGGTCGSCPSGKTCGTAGTCVAGAAPSASSVPTPSRTSVPTTTPTSSPSRTRTATPTRTPSGTGTSAPSRPVDQSATRTPSPSRTPVPPTPSQTSAASSTRTSTPTRTPSRSSAGSASSTPASTPSSTPPPACNPANECVAKGFVCGQANVCGIFHTCGTCSSSRVCDPNNKCVCPLGTELVNGECVSNTPTGNDPDFSQAFSQVQGNGKQVNGNVLTVSNGNPNLLLWDEAASLVNEYGSIQQFTLTSTSGTFAVGWRAQTGNPANRVEWRFSSMTGSNAQIQGCLVYFGNDYCIDYGTNPLPTSGGLDIISSLTLNDAQGNVYTSLQMQIGTSVPSTRTFYFAKQYYPELGGVTYYFNGGTAPRSSITRLQLATKTTLRIILSECLDEEEFSRIFYVLTGARPETTNTNVVNPDDNIDCKGASHGKALVAGFDLVITSSGVPAQAIANALVNAAGTPGLGTAFTSVTIVPGTQGAAIGGFPVTGAGASAVGPGVGGGGGGGGLSGGAIAGIVIGSVAGGILFFGLMGLILIALMAAVVAVGGGDNESSQPSRAPEGAQRRSVRNTIRGFFGGVDVMNNPGKGHQSISGRTPAM